MLAKRVFLFLNACSMRFAHHSNLAHFLASGTCPVWQGMLTFSLKSVASLRQYDGPLYSLELQFLQISWTEVFVNSKGTCRFPSADDTVWEPWEWEFSITKTLEVMNSWQLQDEKVTSFIVFTVLKPGISISSWNLFPSTALPVHENMKEANGSVCMFSKGESNPWSATHHSSVKSLAANSISGSVDASRDYKARPHCQGMRGVISHSMRLKDSPNQSSKF